MQGDIGDNGGGGGMAGDELGKQLTFIKLLVVRKAAHLLNLLFFYIMFNPADINIISLEVEEKLMLLVYYYFLFVHCNNSYSSLDIH